MQDSKEKQCLIFVRNNANDTADRIEAYAKKSGMEVVETVFNTDKKAVERLRYYIRYLGKMQPLFSKNRNFFIRRPEDGSSYRRSACTG